MAENDDTVIIEPEIAERIEAAHDAIRIAQAFHEAYEAMAPHFSYETREASAVPWVDVPMKNKFLMIATVLKLLNDGEINATRR